MYASKLGSDQPQELYRQEGGKNCIWRDTSTNHWWISSCSSYGIIGEMKYLPSNYHCPNDGKKGDWRRGGTDTVLNGYVKIYG